MKELVVGFAASHGTRSPADRGAVELDILRLEDVCGHQLRSPHPAEPCSVPFGAAFGRSGQWQRRGRRDLCR